MVRTVTQNYGIWLAGYYDDFTGAKAIPDDENSPSLTVSYDHKKSHYGNPMNGEATINPRYRWSFADRGRSIGSAFVSTTANKTLSNNGVFEWVTYDSIRQSSNKWEGRAQLQFPDSHANANRYKYNADDNAGTDNYHLICNSYDSSKRYIIATGDNDSTFGRKSMKGFTEANYEVAGGYSSAGQMTSSAGDFVQRAHLAGVWQGEKLKNTTGADFAHTGAVDIFAPITSPAKTPFLCIQSYHKQHNSASTEVAVCYDGSLNSRLNEDIFTIRVAVRSIISYDDEETQIPIVKLQLGSSSPTTLQNGLGGVVVDYTLDLSAYATLALLYDGNTTKVNVDNDNNWIDIDVVLDYDNNQYKVYQDGVLKQTTGSFTITPEQLYGWQIKATPTASYAHPSIITVMVDRAALYQPITDHVDGRVLAPINSFTLKQLNNGIGQCSFTIFDDSLDEDGTSSSDYSHNPKNIFMSSSIVDWQMLFFPNDLGSARIDRPLWSGILDNVNITQKVTGGRIIKIDVSDRLKLLSSQLPMWEIGQGGLSSSEDGDEYWLYDAKGFNEIMDMGVRKLRTLKPTVGFDVDDSYVERVDQRTQLGSAHPIQMYNNEDDFGPNSMWEQYEGAGIIGIARETGYVRTITLEGNPGWSSGAVSISNMTTANNNFTATPANSVIRNGNQILRFNSGSQFTYGAGSIVYAGKYKPTFITTSLVNEPPNIQNACKVINPSAPHNETSVYNLIFDADPLLNVGDRFYIAKNNGGLSDVIPSTLADKQHKVITITKSFNYFSESSLGNYVWIVETGTSYGSSGSEWGSYTSDDLKGLTLGLDWSKETGNANLTLSPDISSRNIHSKWMQDLPNSLWFNYHFAQVTGISGASAFLAATVTRNDTSVKVSDSGDNSLYTSAPSSGVAQLFHPNNGTTTFIYKGKYSSGNDRYLIGCKFISQSYPTAENSGSSDVSIKTKVTIATLNNNYKHLWLLWSDMRNNTLADADGGTRNKDFGLLFPTQDNYDLNINFVDQFNSEGKVDSFTSLKAGDDYLMWNIDSTNDPSTSGAFSKPADYDNSVTATSFAEDSTGNTKLKVTKSSHGLSVGDYIHLFNTDLHDGMYEIESKTTNTFTFKANTFKGADNGELGGLKYAPLLPTSSQKSNTPYQDWENKGGAFVVIDTAPFFNLNTLANGAIIGKDAGDKTDLGDYVATVSGFPMLIDNYYAEALSSYKTVASPYVEHPNSRRLVVSATTLLKDLKNNNNYMYVGDTTDFANSGLGRITAVKGSGRDMQIAERYFSWHGKTPEISKTTSAAADTTYYGTHNYGSGNVAGRKITVAGENFETLGVEVGAILLATSTGKKYTISAITTTSSTNDSLLIHDFDENNFSHNLDDHNSSYDWVTELNVPYGAPFGYGYNQPHGGFRDISSEWAGGGGTAFIIQEQLNHVWTTSVGNIVSSAIESPSAVENEISNILANIPYSERRIVGDMIIEGEEPAYDTITINSSVSSQYMLRLMVELEGKTKAPNVGSYYESDKFRLLFNTAITRQWLPPTAMPFTYNFNNIPVTYNMTVDGTINNFDDYGSTLDTRNKDLMAIILEIEKKSGVGSTYNTTFSYLQGKDGKFEFRPKYNSGYDLSRSNINVSNLEMSMEGQADRVRVYYNNAKSFVDFPKTTSFSGTNKWKVLQEPTITQNHEALSLAESEYDLLKTPSLKLKVHPMLDALDYEPMLTDGRHGYIADAQVALQGSNDVDHDSSAQDVGRHRAWTFVGTGGVLKPGMVNALDGNQKTTTDIYDRYGSSKTVAGDDIAYDDNFYWYGANSLANALQIVHIPKRMPYISEASNGHELRVFVALKNAQTSSDIETAEFVIGLVDYAFSTTAGTGGGAPVLTETLQTNGIQTVAAKQNGFYEITVPASYSSTLNSAGAKVIVSFNAEYCKALLRHRSGSPTATDGDGNKILRNAHDVTGYASFDTYNTDSIFPLGLRKYTELGTGWSGSRAAYYAPRIQITPDFAYTPATFVKYTDAGLNLTNEVMVIKELEYSIKSNSIRVNLSLEKDESKSASSVLSYLFPSPPPPPPSQFVGDFPPPVVTTPFVTDDANPNIAGNMASGNGNNFSQYDSDNTFDSANNSMVFGSSSLNSLTSSAYKNIKGRMSLSGDQFSNQGEFSILGQKKPTNIPSSMKGESINFSVADGTANISDDGFSLPASGTNPLDEGAVYQSAVITATVRVPSDSINDEISLSGLISCDATGQDTGNALVTVQIKCLDTGSIDVKSLSIPTGTNRQTIPMIPNTQLSGASIPNNRIEVKIIRRDDSNDTSSSSVIFHDVELQFNRAGMQGKSASNQFRPYQ